MTGGGFGGCIVAISPINKVEQVRKMMRWYERRTGLKEDFYVCTASQGVNVYRIHSQGIAPDGKPFRCFDITNNRGMTISIMDWGATWVSCRVPVEQQLVLLGCQIEGYRNKRSI